MQEQAAEQKQHQLEGRITKLYCVYILLLVKWGYMCLRFKKRGRGRAGEYQDRGK